MSDVDHGNTKMSIFLFFLDKGHKIFKILALLTTELSSYEICKVAMLFCIQWALIESTFQNETLRETFLNVA